MITRFTVYSEFILYFCSYFFEIFIHRHLYITINISSIIAETTLAAIEVVF